MYLETHSFCSTGCTAYNNSIAVANVAVPAFGIANAAAGAVGAGAHLVRHLVEVACPKDE